MKPIITLIILIFSSFILNAQSLSVKDLTCEHKVNPVIDMQHPRLSWKIMAAGNNVLQTAYQIRVSTDSSFSNSKLVWNTGKVLSDESVLQKYQGDKLTSGQQYYWQVKIWDNKGRESNWSAPAHWETGLLHPSEWKAQWIELKGDTNRYSPSPYLRKEFTISKEIDRAVAYVTAHGLFELHL
ncbi:MAG: hypothetical protein PHP72_09715, partial [Dysgonamonadaceae bacterium]|nr:hypothetical protein [Dysgonamonadaceae bacterium]